MCYAIIVFQYTMFSFILKLREAVAAGGSGEAGALGHASRACAAVHLGDACGAGHAGPAEVAGGERGARRRGALRGERQGACHLCGLGHEPGALVLFVLASERDGRSKGWVNVKL